MSSRRLSLEERPASAPKEALRYFVRCSGDLVAEEVCRRGAAATGSPRSARAPAASYPAPAPRSGLASPREPAKRKRARWPRTGADGISRSACLSNCSHQTVSTGPTATGIGSARILFRHERLNGLDAPRHGMGTGESPTGPRSLDQPPPADGRLDALARPNRRRVRTADAGVPGPSPKSRVVPRRAPVNTAGCRAAGAGRHSRARRQRAGSSTPIANTL